MNQRYTNSPNEVAGMDTAKIRENFLITDLMQQDKFSFTYSHYDRAIIGSAVPVNEDLELPNYDALKSDYFLERRELGIINIGGDGEVNVDGSSFKTGKLDAVYVGMGSKKLVLKAYQKTNQRVFIYSQLQHIGRIHPD